MGSLRERFAVAVSACVLALGSGNAGVIESVHWGAGTTAFKDLLGLGYEARSLAMGKVQIGMPNDVFGAFGNPATFGYLDKTHAMVSYHPVLVGVDIRAGAMAFARPSARMGVWGLSIPWLSYGTIEGVDEQNRSTGETYTPYGLWGSLSWARRVGATPLSVGAAVKGIYGTLDYEGQSADALAFDAGAQYRVFNSRLVLGILMRNLGFLRSGYSEETDDALLPAAFGAGISYSPRHASVLRMAFDIEKPIDDYLHYRFGVEVAPIREYLFLRTGADFTHRDLREALRTLRGEQDEEYQKTNWYLWGFGVGAVAPLGEVDLRVDTALYLKVAHLPPGYCVTVSAAF